MKEKALRSGTRLNSTTDTYTIVNVIGAGGFGMTYKAWMPTKVRNIEAKAFVAIKEHFPSDDCQRSATTSSITFSDTARERFSRSLSEFIDEARCLQRIAGLHPNIVNVNEVFEANNTAYYVMEYLEGQTLKQYVKTKGALSVKETLTILMPVIEAMATLHQNKFTHMDFKPSNIMLATDEDNNVKPVLIDFGLAKHYNPDGSATATLTTTGFSDGYAPVEQYSGITRFSPQTDVYAIAATMLFCLTARTPTRAAEMSQSHLLTLIPDTVPQKLRKVLMVAMAFQSADRFPNASQLYLLLKPIAEAEGVIIQSDGIKLYPAGNTNVKIGASRTAASDNTRLAVSDNTIISDNPHRPQYPPHAPDISSQKPGKGIQSVPVSRYDRPIARPGTPTWIWVIIMLLLAAVIVAGLLVYKSMNAAGSTPAAIDAPVLTDNAPESNHTETTKHSEQENDRANLIADGETTPDLSFHSLSGPVKSCTNHWGAKIPFDKEGNWVGNYDDNLGPRTFIRDSEGRIITEIYHSDKYGDGEINYTWDGNRIESMTDENRGQEVYYTYNPDGSIATQTNHTPDKSVELSFYNETKDRHGNWVSRKFTRTSYDGMNTTTNSGTHKRTITYY